MLSVNTTNTKYIIILYAIVQASETCWEFETFYPRLNSSRLVIHSRDTFETQRPLCAALSLCICIIIYTLRCNSYYSSSGVVHAHNNNNKMIISYYFVMLLLVIIIIIVTFASGGFPPDATRRITRAFSESTLTLTTIPAAAAAVCVVHPVHHCITTTHLFNNLCGQRLWQRRGGNGLFLTSVYIIIIYYIILLYIIYVCWVKTNN